MHQKCGTHFLKISACLSTSLRERIEVAGFLTILLRQTIFQLMLNRRHLYVGRLSQNITASEMEEYCIENNVELLHIRQISKSEAHLKAFHCVFKFDEEKVELPDFWPENVTVSRFYLNEAARDWKCK